MASNPLALPNWLKASARVDLALVLSGAREMMRTELSRPVSAAEVGRWARFRGLYASCDPAGFVALGQRPGVGRRLLALDAAPGDHVHALGRMLGYPTCCCRAARAQGEAEIDRWAARPRRFLGRFQAIDPSGYLHGNALVSHVPCSAQCRASLALAARVRRSGLASTPTSRRRALR